MSEYSKKIVEAHQLQHQQQYAKIANNYREKIWEQAQQKAWAYVKENWKKAKEPIILPKNYDQQKFNESTKITIFVKWNSEEYHYWEVIVPKGRIRLVWQIDKWKTINVYYF